MYLWLEMRCISSQSGVDMLRMPGGGSCGCDAARCWYVLVMEMVVVMAILVLVLVTIHHGTCSLM